MVHCAGTSVEDSKQTFHRLHVEGTRSAVTAAEQARVKKFVLVSYLNVRPNVKSEYHTTKWQGEEIVRASKLNFTILKAGLVYGQGDHLLHNLSNLFRKMPIFAAVGLREKTVRLVAVEDLVEVIRASLDEDRFARQTVAVLGPEEFPFSQAARRIAKAMGKPSLIVLPFPCFLSSHPGIFLRAIYAEAIDHKIPGADACRWNQSADTREHPSPRGIETENLDLQKNKYGRDCPNKPCRVQQLLDPTWL